MSETTLATGELAALVTYLEMTDRPALEPQPSAVLSLERWAMPAIEPYRHLFRLVGAPWLWFSRLVLPADQLADVIGDPEVEVYRVRNTGERDVGMLELDFRQPSQCELAFVGLTPELSGRGHGRWLLDQALRLGWRDGICRVHVHTCSLDHPAALSAYRRAGFVPYKRSIERFFDPRLLEILPRDCAAQIPIIAD